MIDLELLGNHIRELRHKKGLTQSEFADILAVSFQAVSNWERGITPPDIENLVRIASYFGVLVDSLLSPMTEDVYIGIDGGGTKTEFVAVSRTGSVLKRIVKSGCNPNDGGYGHTEELICDGINEIISEHPSVKSIFGGIAGMTTGNYADRLYTSLKKLLPKVDIQIKTDAFNIFGLCDNADMAVISGTGSVVFVKSKDSYKRLGGWGYLFDRAGSAYDIGRDAVCSALKEEDMQSPPSMLSKMLLKRMNTATVWEHINTLYGKGKPYIAELASVVFDVYREGDQTARQIIDDNARALAELLNMGVELHGASSTAIASGGMFEHYGDIMLSHIAKHSDVKVIIGGLPPIYGACRNACIAVLHEMPDDFYENFKKTYGELTK